MRNWLLKVLGETTIEGPTLSDSLLPDGRRQLNRDLKFWHLDGRTTAPKGYVTDYSSYPRHLIPWILTFLVLVLILVFQVMWSPLLFLLILLVPRHFQTANAGIRHDVETDNIVLDRFWFPIMYRANFGWGSTALSGDPHASVPQVVAGILMLNSFGMFVLFGKSLKEKRDSL